MVSERAGGFFDDALLGADGTAEPRRRTTYGDALAQDTAAAQEWGGFALPRLPVAPGSDERAARALVEADPLPDERAAQPALRAAGEPGPAPRPALRPAARPAPVPAPPLQRSAPPGRGGPPRSQAPARGWQAQPGTRPAWYPAPRRESAPAPTIRSSSSGALLAIFLVILLAAYLLIR